ncbi:ASCH domain-containing protein [Zeaxanthinibacter enoshimensis]|uniref:Uncharacterized protein YhfF n=1 Tax=Zeaxanthinibacter enoshimensis TaxID=392009 RepID=A0A4V3D3Y9_9FLAO|nr:ASCH domain-containing protein [Zeaxanthinibacter enoshimensis]TDQ32211.1 uncharacterized protein YhfF [Zeaxanthinibacter enoshimensis]
MRESGSRSIVDFWNEFLSLHPGIENKDLPESYYFCDNEKDANECAELVVKKIKRATATSLWWFKKFDKPLPETGDLAIITDWEGTPKAVIETVRTEPTPYSQVTPEFAATEGEGDGSLDYWKKVHKAYYQREMEPYGEKFEDDMIIICEYFKTIYVGGNS